MAHVEQVTLATANTYFGQVTRTAGGLYPIAHADILLLQEVFNPTVDALEQALGQAGFELIHAAGRFGLAIALRSESTIRPVDGSLREHTLQPISKVEKALARRFARQKHEFTDRGMLAAKFVTPHGNTFTAVTTHPAVAVTPRRRAAQIAKIGDELADPYYYGSLVLTGDMNHYPGPKAVDRALRHKASLTLVDLNGEPTWYAEGSKQEKYLRIASLIQRRPIEAYNGHLDDVLYRGKGIKLVGFSVIDINSDHRAVAATFRFSTPP